MTFHAPFANSFFAWPIFSTSLNPSFYFPQDPRLNINLQKKVSTGSLIDMETFSQILELDEDEETHDFSRPMVWEYFEQAEKTFREMDDAVSAS